jgi:hypothetical protein
MDSVLDAFVTARDQADAEQELERLLMFHSAAIVRRIIARRLGSSHDGDDVESQVMLQLMLRLRQGKSDDTLRCIETFAGYVAAAAHHACDHHVRRMHPARWRLRNRLRYLLEHDARFAIWKAPDGEWLCGRAEWRAQKAAASSLSPDVLTEPRREAGELLLQMFGSSGAPMELSHVVDLAAAAWSVPAVEMADARVIDTLQDRQAAIDDELGQRRKAARVWCHVCELPLRQRQALLLNLRDDGLALFLLTGIATLATLASALEMSPGALAELWNDLPMPDRAIAARLGCTPQQVINLRMAARKRLANRLAGWS